MITSRQILAVVDRIVAEFSPRRVVLFGSYASGTPTEESDVDLLVEVSHRGAYAKSVRIREAVGDGLPLDMKVYSPSEVRWRLAERDMYLEGIFVQGIVLHEAINAGVGNQGRKRLRSVCQTVRRAVRFYLESTD